MKNNAIKISFTAVLFVIFTAGCLWFAAPVWSAESDYYGTYAGDFSGDDSGYWVAIISSSPSDSVFLSYSTTYDMGDGGYIYYWGEYGEIGNYYSYSVINGTYIDAYINGATNSVGGEWSNSSELENGTFTGNAITSCPQEGNYSGTIAGDATGTWSMTVHSNCYITGSVSLEEETASFEGGAHPDGYLVVIGTDSYGNDFSVYGEISGPSASGLWYSETGDAGTFDTTGSGGGGSGGGGGGCFIGSLVNK
jgi:hypothetical protein